VPFAASSPASLEAVAGKAHEAAETEFELLKGKSNWDKENLDEQYPKIPEERSFFIQQKAYFACQLLRQVGDVLQITLNDNKDLSEVAQEAYSCVQRIDNLN